MTQAMDERFAYFYEDEGFGPAIQTHSVSVEIAEKFRRKLPDQLLKYWLQYGWSGYGKGLFWLTDPDEYQPALEAWLSDTPFERNDSYYVIGRTAFGELYVWGTKTGQSLLIVANGGMIFPRDNSDKVAKGASDRLIQSFLTSLDKKRIDQADRRGKPLFERANRTLGPLLSDEMYGFEPALVLGGAADLKHLRKLKVVEHLVLLAQLGDRQVMRDIVQDATAAGLMNRTR